MVAAIARPPGIPVANEIALDCITAWLIHFWAARSSSFFDKTFSGPSSNNSCTLSTLS